MDHPCYKCGQSVEDGKPFCLQCGAPQIRVAMPEPAAPSVAGGVSATELPVFSSDPPRVPGALSASTLSPGIVWPRALQSCAVAAVIAILLAALRLMVPMLAVLSAGFLAVIFYRSRNPAWKAGARSGAQLGATSGLLFSGISGIFAALIVALLQAGGQVRQEMLTALQQAASRSSDPQIQAALDLLKTPEGLASKMVRGVLLLSLVSIAAGSLAGALTGAFLGRRKPP